MPRDRRWDHLYERERRPVKAWLLERFAEELAATLSAWPPPFEQWVPDELLARHRAGRAAPRPPADALAFALELARLELVREYETIERRLAADAPRRWPDPAAAAAGHLVVRLVTEQCLRLQEEATGARLRREELAAAVDAAATKLAGATSSSPSAPSPSPRGTS